MNTEEVLHKYFTESTGISFQKFGKGAINLTYLVEVKNDGRSVNYILQKMGRLFDVSMMEDIEAITKHLVSKNILTQEVLKTQGGALFVRDGVFWWRLFTFIPGITFSTVLSAKQAYEAGRLVGVFHTALSDLEYKFKCKLPHYRDTDFYMSKLKNILDVQKSTEKYNQLNNLAQDVLISYKKLPKENILPKRIIHGDLKIDNVIFNEKGDMALALTDFDTLMWGTIAVDFGDALRSWCMPGGEDAPKARFDIETYNAALEGYQSVAKFLTEEEKGSIPQGVKLITLELAARFVIDAFEENYFKLDASKYKNLFEQNKKKAENQFKFFEEFSVSDVRVAD